MMGKCLLLTAAILAAGPAASAQYPGLSITPRVRRNSVNPIGLEAVVERVRVLDRMIYRVGFGLSLGEFFELSQECLRTGTPDDFKRLMTDFTPLVRVLGLICLAQSVESRELATAAESLSGDRAAITYTNGCVSNERTTVGGIARSLIEKRFFIAGEALGRR